jgi:4-hydroxy-tetrahydrodipicolinate synthase
MTTSSLRNLSGFMPAVPTPFTTEDRIDFAAFEHFCALQIAAGATGLVVCGTTGEAPTLAAEEQRDLVLAARSVTRGRVPLIAGAGSNATAHAIALSRAAQIAGADALLSVVPYYNKPTQAGMLAHFTAIADAVDVPVILYDIPARTVVGLTDATVARLAAHPRIIGLKDATGDISRPARLKPLLRSDFRLFSGDDATALACIAQGADGCISVASNVAPQLCRKLFDTLKTGNLVAAHALSKKFVALSVALAISVNPVAVKYALNLLGLMSPDVRLPLVPLSQQDHDKLAAVVDEIADVTPQPVYANARLARAAG